MPPNIPEWRKQQLNTRSSDEAAGKIKEAAKWWWGDNPKDIATQAVQDYLLFGAARKGYKLGKKGLESKVVQDLIKKSNQHGDEIVNRVQSEWDNLFPQTVPATTVTITKKTKKKTKAPKPTPKQKYIKPQQTKQKKVHGNPRRKKPR